MFDTSSFESLIEIQNLTWWYPDTPNLIFDHLNMTIFTWDFIFLVWKSGAGKTTLVKFLIRQLTPPKKTIFFKKEDIARFDDTEVQHYRRKIWVIYQDYKLLEWRTVYQNLIVPLHIQWVHTNQYEKQISHYLQLIGLEHKIHTPIEHLSWWEKQRVTIWRALLSQPEFFIADEPTWNLDRDNSILVADTLIKLHKEWNTVILISHDAQLIKYISERTKTTTHSL